MTTTTATEKPTGTTAQLMMLGGSGLICLAFVFGAWTRGEGSPTFKELSDLGQAHELHGFAGLYFAALAWVFLGVIVLLGVGATVPSRFNLAFRIAGVAAAAGGFGAALAGAIHEVGADQLPGKLGLAAWLTLVGYVVIAAGAVLGPWRPKEFTELS